MIHQNIFKISITVAESIDTPKGEKHMEINSATECFFNMKVNE